MERACLKPVSCLRTQQEVNSVFINTEINPPIYTLYNVYTMPCKCNFFFVQIDLKKMPLGKLTRRQIESAYSVLGEAQKVSEQHLTLTNILKIKFKVCRLRV